uniref:BHLH domain-containing protein n=1 Tax=Manihot esculenta TaxID=3983 RepID=A0A2C9WEY2_MANES
MSEGSRELKRPFATAQHVCDVHHRANTQPKKIQKQKTRLRSINDKLRSEEENEPGTGDRRECASIKRETFSVW